MKLFEIDSPHGHDLLIILPFIHILFDPTDPKSVLSAGLALLPHALTALYALLSVSSYVCSLYNPFPSATDPAGGMFCPIGMTPPAFGAPFATALCPAVLSSPTNSQTITLLALGQVLSMCLNWVLKRVIQHPRPSELPGKKEFGMPSSHAQYLFWWAMTMTIFGFTFANDYVDTALVGRGVIAPENAAAWSWVFKVGVLVVTQGLAGLVSWSRLYIGYHFPVQVIVGGLTGVLLSLSWWTLVMVPNSPHWVWIA